ncbi:hypothetical protein LOD99_15133 [Oopsacas minuta]|uniref:Uncharacterized protein n=1 Tax=Oopsacas minuta TaxID=111878 RepID=A0AAV7KD55_9METZ|nr:hypothetical protein LOD99_15133 [Oopsacas minuta]
MLRDYRGLVCACIHELTNLLLDQPGGSENTSTGNKAKAFFHIQNRILDRLSFVPNVYRDGPSEIPKNLSALLRVAINSLVVDVDSFRVLSPETYLLIVQTFPWASISNTLQKSLAHAYQLIERNDRVECVVSLKKG